MNNYSYKNTKKGPAQIYEKNVKKGPAQIYELRKDDKYGTRNKRKYCRSSKSK